MVLGENVPAARVPSAVWGAVLIVVSGVVLSYMASPMAALLATIVLATTRRADIRARGPP
jgi:hypothetical protein